MTQDQMFDLARRAVACKGWRWMDGMRALDGDGVCAFRLTENSGLPGHPEPVVDDSWLPDLTDPATLGCLLALVREAWRDECACVLPIDYGPAGVMWVGRLTAGGRSLTERHWPAEAEAHVASLEAAPSPKENA
jgi:hypothetical protein